nr:hypothetical protein TetV2_00243 [Oceanusvirus sp.]
MTVRASAFAVATVFTALRSALREKDSCPPAADPVVFQVCETSEAPDDTLFPALSMAVEIMIVVFSIIGCIGPRARPVDVVDAADASSQTVAETSIQTSTQTDTDEYTDALGAEFELLSDLLECQTEIDALVAKMEADEAKHESRATILVTENDALLSECHGQKELISRLHDTLAAQAKELENAEKRIERFEQEISALRTKNANLCQKRVSDPRKPVVAVRRSDIAA